MAGTLSELHTPTDVRERLVGWEIHGFHTWQDLDIAKIQAEAKARWLRPNEILAVLSNYKHFQINAKPMDLPPSGTLVLYDRKMLRSFRKDGHIWKKKNDGKTTKEAHERLKVGDPERISVYYARGEENHNFHRRCYWLLDAEFEHIVLVHYREVLEHDDRPKKGILETPMRLSKSYDKTRLVVAHGMSGSPNSVISVEVDSEIVAQCSAGAFSPAMEVSKNTSQLGHTPYLSDQDVVTSVDMFGWDELLEPQDGDVCTPLQGKCQFSEQKRSIFSDTGVGDDVNSMSPEEQVNNSQLSSGTGSSYIDLPGIMTGSTYQVTMTKPDAYESTQNHPIYHLQDSNKVYFANGYTSSTMDDSEMSLLNGLGYSAPNPEIHGPASMQNQSPQDKAFVISDISPSWAFGTMQSKVLITGSFHQASAWEQDTGYLCVFGNTCVPAEIVQAGVMRCIAPLHAPGMVQFYLTLDGSTPISQILSFEYRADSTHPMKDNASSTEVDDWGGFVYKARLSQLLFSSRNSAPSFQSKASTDTLIQTKAYAKIKSLLQKEWISLVKSIESKKIGFKEANSSLLDVSLRNKLLEWILNKAGEEYGLTARDPKGQGIIHLCAVLDYRWAIHLIAHTGASLDFRDASGWTALHWAAKFGRKKMVAVLLSEGANPSLVSDPSSKFVGGCTAADVASKNGYEGLAAYLAEKALTAHFNAMSLSGNASGTIEPTSATDSLQSYFLSEEDLCLKDSLAAMRTAADAASRIQEAFRQNSLKRHSQMVKMTVAELEATPIIAALKIQHAFRRYNDKKKFVAALRIQSTFRVWKIRRSFLNMRKQATKIQAAFRAHLMRKNYTKILWSVGVLEKAILRWRLRRKGLRGHRMKEETTVSDKTVENSQEEEDFYRISRKQAEERVDQAVTRVQAMFRSYRARVEYRELKLLYEQEEENQGT